MEAVNQAVKSLSTWNRTRESPCSGEQAWLWGEASSVQFFSEQREEKAASNCWIHVDRRCRVGDTQCSDKFSIFSNGEVLVFPAICWKRKIEKTALRRILCARNRCTLYRSYRNYVWPGSLWKLAKEKKNVGIQKLLSMSHSGVIVLSGTCRQRSMWEQ